MPEFEQLEQLKRLIDTHDSIVFFGGAGVSTESGIPDFRSVDGLYNQKWDYPPETIVSHTFWAEKTGDFYRFYREKFIFPDVRPNAAHIALAKLEQRGKLKAVVTQNIDGLHQLAGSKTVYELHGSVHRNFCVKCGRAYPGTDIILHSEGVPRCVSGRTVCCDGIIKPDVVLYEESLNEDIMSGAIDAISKADMLIIGGTSLVVYPASGLVRYFRGDKLVVINREPVGAKADLFIQGKIGEVLGAVV